MDSKDLLDLAEQLRGVASEVKGASITKQASQTALDSQEVLNFIKFFGA